MFLFKNSLYFFTKVIVYYMQYKKQMLAIGVNEHRHSDEFNSASADTA